MPGEGSGPSLAQGGLSWEKQQGERGHQRMVLSSREEIAHGELEPQSLDWKGKSQMQSTG